MASVRFIIRRDTERPDVLTYRVEWQCRVDGGWRENKAISPKHRGFIVPSWPLYGIIVHPLSGLRDRAGGSLLSRGMPAREDFLFSRSFSLLLSLPSREKYISFWQNYYRWAHGSRRGRWGRMRNNWVSPRDLRVRLNTRRQYAIFNRFYLDSPLLNDFIRKYNLLGNINVCVKQKRNKK